MSEKHLQKLLEVVKKTNPTFNRNLFLSFTPTKKIGLIDISEMQKVFNDTTFTDKSSDWFIKPCSLELMATKLIQLLVS